MKRLILALVSLFILSLSHAQVGINTSTPHPSAALDITSTSSGILIPRMTLSERNAIGTPETGLLIYQTNNIPGFYYYTGSAWSKVTPDDYWSTQGNSGTAIGTDFIGTTDNVALDFRTNDISRLQLNTKGQLEVFNTGSSVYLGENAGNADDQNDNFFTFVGKDAGAALVGGSNADRFNSAFGYKAMEFATGGRWNIGIGAFSMRRAQTGSEGNVGIGQLASSFLTTGQNNVAIGRVSSFLLRDGSNNTAIGTSSLSSMGSGSNNTAIGDSALGEHSDGDYNTALGAGAGFIGDGNSSSKVSENAVYLGAYAGQENKRDNLFRISSIP